MDKPGVIRLAALPTTGSVAAVDAPTFPVVIGRQSFRVSLAGLVALLSMEIPPGISEAEAEALIADAIAAHVAAPDPHPQYQTGADIVAAINAGIAGHVAAADPHPQYLTTAEAESTYLMLPRAVLVIDEATGRPVWDENNGTPVIDQAALVAGGLA